MLGLIILYFAVIKPYRALATKYNKGPLWQYAILGIVTYYGGLFISIMTILAISEDMLNRYEDNTLGLSLMGIPFGALACYFVYQYLKKKWSKDYIDPELALDEIGTEIVDDQTS